MGRMITAKIDVKKVDKSKLYEGKKGTYLDIVMFETPDNQYGDDFVIRQAVSKEERAAGVKGAILGNAKYLDGGRGSAPSPASKPDDDGEVPF